MSYLTRIAENGSKVAACFNKITFKRETASNANSIFLNKFDSEIIFDVYVCGEGRQRRNILNLILI